ncbi:protein TOPAZ1 isoform X3 [Rhineura floridana]|uniref:protein TOPAZ1 isoform X3 n=1 Tax=Rhineura floridana TaxID=261503 RepID=UPI002AC87FA4|nr:protein TOPAZ1 isoform X3 [Rhineura floridana]
MVQKGQMSKQKCTSVCLLPEIGMEAQIKQQSIAINNSQKGESRHTELSLSPLIKPSNLSKQLLPSSNVLLRKKRQLNMGLVSKRREKRRNSGENSTLAEGCSYIVGIKLEEEKEALAESHSRKAVQSMGRQQHDAISRVNLQKVSRVRKKRESSLLGMGSHEKDTAPGKDSIRPLLEPEWKIQSCMKNAESLRKKHRCSLIKSGLHKEVKSLMEKDESSVTGLKSQKVKGRLQKSNSCSVSKPGPQQKTWNLRERTKPGCSEQKTLRNQNKRQRAKKRYLSSNLESSIPNISLLKHERRKSGIICCKSPQQSPGNCTKNLVRVRSSSVPHLSSGDLVEETKSLVKSPRIRLVKVQETEQVMGGKEGISSIAMTLAKSHVGAEALKQNSRSILKYVAHVEDNKKYRKNKEEENKKYTNTAEERRHRMVTRASLKSKACKNDAGEDILEISTISHGKLSNTDLSISQDCNIQNLLEQSIHLPVSNEAERKDPVRHCFGGEAKVCCDGSSFSMKNASYSQLLDITVAEKVEANALVLYQGEECRWFSLHKILPCTIKRTTPVVRLLDCRYIKALLEPTGIETTQSYKVHCGSLHVAVGQGKVLFSSRGMGQNDLNSSPNIVQPGKSLPEKSVWVEKEVCQNNKSSSKCQNGKRFRESKWCTGFKKSSKRIKMPEGLERPAVQEVHTSMNIPSECGLQMKDKTATAGSLTVLENITYNKTILSSFDHTPDFLLEQPAQKPQNQFANLASNERMSGAHFVTYNAIDFGKSEVLKKQKVVLKANSIESQTDFSNKLGNNSIMETLVSQKITSHNNNVEGCMKREKRTLKEKTVGKTVRKLQLYSCQRVVPICGKNVWPRESCARTYLRVCENHASDSKRGFLRGTDSVINSGHVKLDKSLASTTKASANKITGHKTELPSENPTSKFVLHICKALSATSNENRISSINTEGRPKHCTPSSTKLVKKTKIALNSPAKDAKNRGSIAKRNISIDTHNGAFADRGKSKANCQKTSVAQKELLLKTLIKGNLSNFKIPLLKDNIESRKVKYARSSGRDTCDPLDILEDSSVPVKKARTKTSSDVNSKHRFQSEQVNGITVLKEHEDQFDNVLESLYNETVHNGAGTPQESKLKLAALKGNPDCLSTGYLEKQMFNSVAALETNDKGNYSNNFAEDKANFYPDVLKAYEDDVLVIDVIQDDPDLFGDNEEQEKKHCIKTNLNVSIFSKEKMELELEPPQLPRKSHLKCCPREDPIQDYGTSKSVTDICVSLTEVEVNSEYLSRIGAIGGVTEDGQLTESNDLLKNSDTNEKKENSEKIAMKEEAKLQDTAKIENTQYTESVSHDHQLELALPAMKTASQREVTVVKPWVNDFRFSGKDLLLQSLYPNSYGSWKLGKNAMTTLGLAYLLPYGYCRLHFNTLNGCQRINCWYSHVLVPGNDKIFNEILKAYINIGEVVLLQRAAQIFTDYYKKGTLRTCLDSQMLNDLLTSLLQSYLLTELFHVFHSSIRIKILPTVDILLKVFEQVASMQLKDVVSELIDISCKLLDAGMVLEYEHVNYITKFLNQLQVSSKERTVLISRFQARHFHKASLCDLDSAIAEFQHCKEKDDWFKLGTLYINVRNGCENVGDLEKYSLCIASILTSSVAEERPGIPFCEFAAAVKADACHNETDTTLLGRIGIDIMFSYYKMQQWSKAKKVLDMLHALKIHFTFLNGLLGQERLAPRCQIVNVAVEIFLKCGSPDGAIWALRESEWVINTLSWPCDRMDVLNRHNLLCTIASECMTKSRYREAFEVLQNLPGLQNCYDNLDVSQYSILFNKLLGACSESKNLGISSTVVEFMLAKNIPVEFNLFRALITALGRSSSWLKARTLYKSALALGCYPPLEGNLYRKLLLIPSYMTEIEMLLAVEIFLVSNASSIQSPGASSQILQIVLKRCEGNNLQNTDDYQSAVERLIQAVHISTPKLFIKHLTVNVNMEQVYSLEYASVLKWLKENMKWAGKVWLF